MTDQELLRDLDNFLPKILPPSVYKVAEHMDGYSFNKDCIGNYDIGVIITIGIQADNKRWIHLSISRCNNKRLKKLKFRLPAYEDLIWLKDTFVGENRKVIMVFPAKEYYINQNEVLHLFCCLDDNPLPEFSGFNENYEGGKERTI